MLLWRLVILIKCLPEKRCVLHAKKMKIKKLSKGTKTQVKKNIASNQKKLNS